MKKQYLLAIILLIVGGVIGNTLRFSGRLPDKMADFSVIPNELNGYTGKEIGLDLVSAEVLKADLTTLRDFSYSDKSRIGLFMAYFKSQKYGSQIHSPKHCLPGGGWRIENIRPYMLTLPDGTQKEINQVIIADKNFKSVMFYWYETRSGAIRSEYGLKLDLVKNSLSLNPTDAAIVRVTIDTPENDIKAASKRGLQFIETFYPYIKQALPF
jgi:EpsI family protein